MRVGPGSVKNRTQSQDFVQRDSGTATRPSEPQLMPRRLHVFTISRTRRGVVHKASGPVRLYDFEQFLCRRHLVEAARAKFGQQRMRLAQDDFVGK
jgi:hypothetical protein